jgi:hypothetical protein
MARGRARPAVWNHDETGRTPEIGAASLICFSRGQPTFADAKAEPARPPERRPGTLPSERERGPLATASAQDPRIKSGGDAEDGAGQALRPSP